MYSYYVVTQINSFLDTSFRQYPSAGQTRLCKDMNKQLKAISSV